jgi:drug/metabolite transporter (DMT)-like permease
MVLSDNARGAVYMNVAMLAFTLNDTAMKAVTQGLPLFQAITLRGVLASLALVVLAVASGAFRRMPDAAALRVLGLRTLAEVGGTVLFLAALVHMPLANLSAIMQSMPLAVTLAAVVVFRDRVSGLQLAAILAGLAGVLLIIRPGPEGFDIWALMGLGSVACVVVRDLATRAMPSSLPSLMVAVAASVSVTAMGLAGAMVQGWQPVSASQGGLIVGAALALVVGYIFVVRMMRVGDIGAIAPFRYTALLWAILLGWLAFGTLPDRLTLAGAAIVVLAGLVTLIHGSRSAPRPGAAEL